MDCEPPIGIWKNGFKPKPPSNVRSVSVLFTSDKEIHQLNKTYRGKDKPTDVLSFAMQEGFDASNFATSEGLSLGDIVISLDTTARQAKEYRVSEQQELLRLLIHGTLHLLGYDHEKVSTKDARLMRAVERLLMERYND